jgi:demethylmenaquinone methyltransferase/2-methoxy-6-polyprenyl-1,4-benzoquinol methylase
MSGDNFNRFANWYDVFIHPRKNVVWQNILATNKKQLIIDLGGGTGRLVPHLLNLANRVVLADHSFFMLKISRYAKFSQVDRVCCDLSNLPFKKNINSNFVMVDTIHHLYHPKLILKNLTALVHDKNMLLIEEPDIQFFMIKIIAILERLLGMNSHFYKKEEILDWFPESCFERVIKQDGANFYIILQQKET